MKKTSLLSSACDAFPELSRDELYAAILCGEIYVNGERVRDPGAPVSSGAQIRRQGSTYVSRGGLKLDHALVTWGIDVSGKVMVDAGASTGGFTDCLLHHGASHVHAVDVGYNQLAYRLRCDARVSVHERTNIMDVESLTPPPDAGVVDLSFRSLRGAARHVLTLTREGWAIVLVKPQFELRGRHPTFGGVLRDDDLRYRVVQEIIDALWSEGAYVSALTRSPIAGRRGNREYLFHICRQEYRDKAEILKLLPSIL